MQRFGVRNRSSFWVYPESEHGIDSLLLGAHELVRSFHKGVEMYLSFTPISDPKVLSGLGETCHVSLCKIGIKCKTCNDFFFFLLPIAMAR